MPPPACWLKLATLLEIADPDSGQISNVSLHHMAKAHYMLNHQRRVKQVVWGEGATEGGSSGSPLINADTGKVVGVLTGGFSSCSQPDAPDFYGRLSKVTHSAVQLRQGPTTGSRGEACSELSDAAAATL